TGRVPRPRGAAALLPGRRDAARIVEDAVLRQPDRRLHRRNPERRWRERRRFRRRRVGAGNDQRGRAVVSRAAVGRAAAGAIMNAGPLLPAAAGPDRRHRDVLERFFESYYRLRPVNATFTGVHQHDHRLPDWSPDGLASAVDEMRSVRASLASSHLPGHSLGDVAVRDYELAIAFLDIEIAEHE